jgi:uroporphyrinogen-III synthase
VVAVGPSTRSELEEGHGVKVQVMPEISAMGAMMNALAEYVAARVGKRGREGR